MRKIIAGVDIGSSTLKLVIGEFIKNKVNILAVSEVPSGSIEFGFLTEPEIFIENLKKLFKSAEEIVGLPIKKVIISVSSLNAGFMISEGFSSITNPDGIVKSMDIIRTMQGAVYNKITTQTEIAAIQPMHFRLDDDRIIDNPINQIAKKLYLKAVLVTVPHKNVVPLLKCFELIGVEVIDVTIGGIADYANIRNNDFDNEIGAIINLGYQTTSISIINKGILTNANVLDIGYESIEKDIKFVFKINQNETDKVMEELGIAHKAMASPNNKVVVTNIEGEIVTINQYELAEVINARVEEILNLAKKEINHLTKKEIHYIMLTGGLSEMNDFSEATNSVFSNKAKIVKIKELGVRDNKYSIALGLLKYYNDKMRLRDKEYSILSIEEQEELGTVVKKMNISDDSILGKLFGYFFDN